MRYLNFEWKNWISCMRLNDSSAALDLSERNSFIVVKVNCYLFRWDRSHYDPHLESRPPYLELIGSRAAVSTSEMKEPVESYTHWIISTFMVLQLNFDWIRLKIFKWFHYEHHQTHLNITVFGPVDWTWLLTDALPGIAAFWPKGKKITCQSSLDWNYAIQLICICRRIIEWPRTIIKEPDGHCRRVRYSQL
jgi:hypothetical protein